MKWLGLILWTAVLSVAFFCVGFLAISRAATPRGVGHPLAMAETPDVEKVAKRVERKVDTSNETLSKKMTVLEQRTDLALSQLDLLKKEFEAFKKDTDARFLKSERVTVAEVDPGLPEIHGFTPSWFDCIHCPRVKRESEQAGLPFRVTWSEATPEHLKSLGIPEKASFPLFYWTDSTGRGWYCWNDGSLGDVTTMKHLEIKWREHR